MKSSMASSAPNVRCLDCERLEHDQNDVDRNDERERSTLPLNGSMTNARKIASNHRERSDHKFTC